MLDEKGYTRPKYDEILETKIQTAKELFGEDIETSEQTPLGKFIRIGARDLAKAYEDIEATYYARFPNTATGVSLDRLCVFAGISRNPATYAEHKIKVYGEAGTVVEEIKVCGDNSEIVFYNIENFVLDENGQCEIIVVCETAGKVGNITEINDVVNPIAGVERVEYIGTERYAENTETDPDLRKRFAQAIEGSGSTNKNAIIAEILRVETVKSVSIIENSTNGTVDGRPAHSFECYVYGGTEEKYKKEIAQAIYNKKPIGITACSTAETGVTVDVLDDGGTPHPISFSYTVNTPIYISIKYKKNTKFSTDGETQIINALTEHINNLGVGSSVVISSLYGYIYGIEGVRDVTELLIGTTKDNLSNINIDMLISQVPITDSAKITVVEDKT